jgi:transcription initiation factor TFIIIB Brf1 subunit/transcription initiation factor TFIIB
LGFLLDLRPEKSGYGEGYKANPTRHNATHLLFPETALGTQLIGGKGQVSQQIAVYNRQTIPYTERSLKKRCDLLYNIGRVSGIAGSILDRAQQIYAEAIETQRQYHSKSICRGNKTLGLMAGVLFYTLEEHKCPREVRELARMFEIDPCYVTRGRKMAFELINYKRHMVSQVRHYSDFVDRFCSLLQMSKADSDQVRQTAHQAYELGILVTNNPASAVAGVIRFVVRLRGLPISVQQIHLACNKVSTATINKIFQRLWASLEELTRPSEPITGSEISPDLSSETLSETWSDISSETGSDRGLAAPNGPDTTVQYSISVDR